MNSPNLPTPPDPANDPKPAPDIPETREMFELGRLIDQHGNLDDLARMLDELPPLDLGDEDEGEGEGDNTTTTKGVEP